MITLRAENIKLVSENRRLIRSKHGGMCSNPKYAKAKTMLYFCFKNSWNGEKLNKNICMFIDVDTYLDLDNICKPIIDTVERLGCIENDREVLALYVHKYKIKRGQPDSVTVRIWEKEG
jgi:Holliday junction resolvase RusA-like endonuclease